MNLGHTSCRKGKQVVVVLRDGTRLEDRFVEADNKSITLKVYGRIPKTKIRSFQIRKQEGS